MVSFEALNLTHQLSLQQIDANCRKSITVLRKPIDIGKNRGEKSTFWNLGYECKVKLIARPIEGFKVADFILVVGQTLQHLQWMYGKNRDFDARSPCLKEGWYSEISVNCKLKILAKRGNRLNLKSIGLLTSEKSSF